MGFYYIGDVLSHNPQMVNGCQEAILANFDSSKHEPYSLVFFEHSSIDGYYFKLDTRTEKMLDNAYVDCINPHFCSIQNLYNLLSYYELFLLGYQTVEKVSMNILYLRTENKYFQIFISNNQSFYQNLPANKMFVYIYEASSFEALKLSIYGKFFRLNNWREEPIPIFNSNSLWGNVYGIDFLIDNKNICSIQQYKDYQNLYENGFNSTERYFTLCKNLNEFKTEINV